MACSARCLIEFAAFVVTHKERQGGGLAYAIASRLARQVAIDIGGARDRYGGIGRNGALKTPGALDPGTLQAVGLRNTDSSRDESATCGPTISSPGTPM